jgi:hypothetical protein
MVVGFVCLIPVYLVYRFSTTFSKTIVVKDKYVISKSNRTYYTIVASDDKMYRISNDIYTGTFNHSDMYASVDKGKKYKIDGFGMRVPIIGLYTTIYNIQSPE